MDLFSNNKSEIITRQEVIVIAEKYGFRLVKEIKPITFTEFYNDEDNYNLVMINDLTNDLLFISSENDDVDLKDCEILLFRNHNSYNYLPDNSFLESQYIQKRSGKYGIHETIDVFYISENEEIFEVYENIIQCVNKEKAKDKTISWESLPYSDLLYFIIPEYFSEDIMMRPYIFDGLCTNKELQIIKHNNNTISFLINYLMFMHDLEKSSDRIIYWDYLFADRYNEFAKILLNWCKDVDTLTIVLRIAFTYCEKINNIERNEMLKYIQALKENLNLIYKTLNRSSVTKVPLLDQQKIYPDNVSYAIADIIIKNCN